MSLKDRLLKIESRTAQVVPMSDEDNEKILQWLDGLILAVNEGVHESPPFFDRKARAVDQTDVFLENIISGK